jgi:hypothetical protein
MHQPSSFQEFASLARRWKPYFRQVSKIAVALRSTDGWHLRFSQIAFTAIPPAVTAQAFEIETRSLRAFRQVASMTTHRRPKPSMMLSHTLA